MTRIGLVLGAGGVAGQAFHAGVLTALDDVAGFDARRAEVIVGTSAGSIAAAFLRAGRGGHELLGRFGSMPAGPSRGSSEYGEEALASPAAAAGLAVARPGRARIGGRIAGLVPAGVRAALILRCQRPPDDAAPDRGNAPADGRRL